MKYNKHPIGGTARVDVSRSTAPVKLSSLTERPYANGMNVEFKSLTKIFITGCLWGTIGLFVKLMEAEGSSASYTSFLRLFFGAILLAVMTLIFDGAKAFRIGWKTLVSCILLGVVCQGTFNILYSMSVSINGMAV